MFRRKRNNGPALPPEPTLNRPAAPAVAAPAIAAPAIDGPEPGLTEPALAAPKRRGWFSRRPPALAPEPSIPTAPAGPAEPLRPGEPTFGSIARPRRGWFGRTPPVPASPPVPAPPTAIPGARGEDTAGGAAPPGLIEGPGGVVAFLLLTPAAVIAFGWPLTLAIPLPGWLHAHLPTVIFALLFLLMLASARLPATVSAERAAGGGSLLVLMLAGAVALGSIWTGGEGPRAVGGLLPVGAAHDLYINALAVGEGGSLVFGTGWQASAVGPMATALGVTGQNLQAAIALLTFFALLSAFLAALAVARSHGPGAGAMTLAVLAAYYFDQILGTTAPVAGSFMLGCCGFALVWEAGRARRGRLFALGLLLLTLAIMLAGGAVLAVVLLLFWGTRRFGGTGGAKPGWIWFGGGVLAVAGGVALHAGCELVWGDPGAAPLGGVLTNLYGLVGGGEGAQALMADHRPRFTPGMTEAERVSLMATLTWELFLADPAGLVTGLVAAWRMFLFGLGWLFFADSVVVRLVLVVVSLCGLWQALRPGRRPSEAIAGLGAVGIVATMPFLGDDPADGLAATIPFMAAIAGLGIALLSGRLLRVSGRPAMALIPPSGGLIAPTMVGLGLVITVLPGPLLIRGLVPAAVDRAGTGDPAGKPCADGLDRLMTRLPAGSAITLFGGAPPAGAPGPALLPWGRLPAVWLGDDRAVAAPADLPPGTLAPPRLSAFVPVDWLDRKAAAGDRAVIRYGFDPMRQRNTIVLASESVLLADAAARAPAGPAAPPLAVLCGRDLGFHFEVANPAQ